MQSLSMLGRERRRSSVGPWVPQLGAEEGIGVEGGAYSFFIEGCGSSYLAGVGAMPAPEMET